MKTKGFIAIIFIALISAAFYYRPQQHCAAPPPDSKGCVFKTVFGEEPLDTAFLHFPSKKVAGSVQDGLAWLKKAQQKDGGWGAGSHYRQNVLNPHAVATDPATTAMVAMAILRSGSTLDQGPYREELKKATDYLIKAIELAPANGSNITTVYNTQIQSKLGQNIDLVLSTQFLSNLLGILEQNHPLRERIFNNLNKCVDNLQQVQNGNGSIQGAGWAGVLQSAFANNALESAQVRGAWVNEESLEKSRDYQKGNFDTESQKVATTDGAGIVLYSVSGSTRASAKEARQARDLINMAKQDGLLDEDDEISVDNLIQSGVDKDQALKYYSSYKVYESAKIKAQDRKVMQGFGNNGGEEFLSYLQTGESLIINKDLEWKNWFDNVSGQLLHIQNKDGSWNGHHCITSPVFCTATCVLILSVNNDIDDLLALGSSSR